MILDLITTKNREPSVTFGSLSVYYNHKIVFKGYTMKQCSNLFYLSTIACKLSECLSEQELTTLAADLVVLSDMLANLLAHQDIYEDASQNTL